MATVNGLTAARALEIEANAVVGGSITDGVLSLIKGDASEIEIGDVGGGGGGGTPPVVTSLPVSPANGDEVIFMADGPSRAFWRMHCRDNTEPYPWEFEGGRPIYAFAGSSENLAFTANTWRSAGTTDLDIILTQGGNYDVEFCGGFQGGAAEAVCSIGIAAGVAGTPATERTWTNNVEPSHYVEAAAFGRILSVSAYTTIRMRFLSSVSQNMFILQRRMKITPINLQ